MWGRVRVGGGGDSAICLEGAHKPGERERECTIPHRWLYHVTSQALKSRPTCLVDVQVITRHRRSQRRRIPGLSAQQQIPTAPQHKLGSTQGPCLVVVAAYKNTDSAQTTFTWRRLYKTSTKIWLRFVQCPRNWHNELQQCCRIRVLWGRIGAWCAGPRGGRGKSQVNFSRQWELNQQPKRPRGRPGQEAQSTRPLKSSKNGCQCPWAKTHHGLQPGLQCPACCSKPWPQWQTALQDCHTAEGHQPHLCSLSIPELQPPQQALHPPGVQQVICGASSRDGNIPTWADQSDGSSSGPPELHPLARVHLSPDAATTRATYAQDANGATRLHG